MEPALYTLDAPVVLVADDNPTDRLLMCEALAAEGFAVHEAGDGVETLQAVERRRPDAVLLDMRMPQMDGFGVLSELRLRPATEHLPVIVVTGLDDCESINRSYDMGATAFISKPINWTNLSHHVRYVVRASRTFEELRQSEARLANAQRIAGLGNWECDLRTNRFALSPEICRMFQLEEPLPSDYRAFLKMMHGEDRLELQRTVRAALRREESFRLEARIVLPGEGLRHLQARGEIRRDEAGRATAMAGTLQDITRHKETEEKLRLGGKVFEHSSEMIIVTDARTRIVDVNPAFCEVTGYTREEVCGRDIHFLKEGGESWSSADHRPSLERSAHWQGEILGRRKNGESFPALLSISAARNEQGAITHYVGIATDISQLKKAQKRIQFLAYHDPLTGLPNRNLFKGRLEQSFLQANRDGKMAAILALNLDGFKEINDSLGHSAGDWVIIQVAKRLQGCLRQSDAVSRTSGDEFTIVSSEIDRTEDVIPLVERITRIFTRPFALKEKELYLTASIGVALYPHDGKEPGELLKKAETAVHHAKQKGRNRFQYFSEDMNLRSKERLTLLTSLHKALAGDEFVPFYQPKVDMRGRLRGFEALVRWLHPQQGMIPPDRFIGLAEETGLIVPIGQKVLLQACAQSRLWQSEGYPPLPVAVNLSPHQLKSSDLVSTVQWALKKTGMEPRLLELEITESSIMEESEKAIETLTRLKKMGIRVAMDDFGTGYSSLGHLRRFPIDTLKIDRSFISELLIDEDAAAIVKAVIAMARSLKLKTIAEGVETQAQLDALRELGCDEIQGFLISRPLPAEQATNLFVHPAGRDAAGNP